MLNNIQVRNKASKFIRRTWIFGSPLRYHPDPKKPSRFFFARVVNILPYDRMIVSFEVLPDESMVFNGLRSGEWKRECSRYGYEVSPLKCDVERLVSEGWVAWLDDDINRCRFVASIR